MKGTSPRSFADELREIAHHCEERSAVITSSTSLSYGQLWHRIDQVGNFLQQQSIRSLALLADNSLDWIIVDLACLANGIVCIPLPRFFSIDQIQHALHLSQVDAVAHDPADLIKLPDADNGTSCALPSTTLAVTLREGTHPAYPPTTAKITFTSGSTGTPKGVCLSEANIQAVVKSLNHAIDDLKLHTHLSLLPYATLLENLAGIYLPFLRGGSIYVAGSDLLGLRGSRMETIGHFLRTVEDTKAESIIIVPQILKMLLDALDSGWRVPATLKFVAVGGGKTPSAWIQQAQLHHLPVYEGYGLSECASVVALNTPRYHKTGSVGRILSHCRVRIEDGEIIVSGNHYLGYFNPGLVPSPPSTADQPLVSDTATGDLGFLDEEGYLHIMGRKNNVLISTYGRNISPEWPETELLATGLFRQCLVLGDARPYCIALLIPAANTLTLPTIQKAIENVNGRLPDYAQIRQWALLKKPFSIEDGLLTTNGRLKRKAIEKTYEGFIAQLYKGELEEEGHHGILLGSVGATRA
ncbi:MAG: AMP-binding protein [Nitrospirota bacterium]